MAGNAHKNRVRAGKSHGHTDTNCVYCLYLRNLELHRSAPNIISAPRKPKNKCGHRTNLKKKS